MLLIRLDTLFSIFCNCSMYLCYGCQDLKEKGQDSGWKSWICYVGPGQGGNDTQIIVIRVSYLSI